MTDSAQQLGDRLESNNSTPAHGNVPTADTSDSGSTNNLEWRFDIDFGLNPNWLSSPAPGNLPIPLSLFNDWIRNIQTRALESTQPNASTSTGSVAPLTFDTLQNSDTSSISTTSGTRTVPSDDSHSHTFPRPNPDNPLILRSSQGATPQSLPIIGPHLNESDYMPLPPSSSAPVSHRRSSRPTIIELPPAGSQNWSSNTPAGESNSNVQEEPRVDSPGRTVTEILRQSPEAKAFLAVLERYIPFVLILLMKGVLDHVSGLTVFFALLLTFSHANTLVRREVTKQGKRSLLVLLMVIINLIICIFCLYYVFQDEKLYPALIFLPSNILLQTVNSLLWLVLVTDYVVKFITLIMKSLVIMLPDKVVPFQKRGKYYLFIESSSQLYRCLLPIYPWFLYLFEAYDGSFKFFSIVLCSLYFMCKAVDVAQRCKAWKFAFRKFLQPVHYGTVPTQEEIDDLFCPICHDGFSNPTKLSCGHIFCEDCVSTWLDRGERSCPMCRARVVDDTSWRDGATTKFIQIF